MARPDHLRQRAVLAHPLSKWGERTEPNTRLGFVWLDVVAPQHQILHSLVDWNKQPRARRSRVAKSREPCPLQTTTDGGPRDLRWLPFEKRMLRPQWQERAADRKTAPPESSVAVWVPDLGCDGVRLTDWL